MILKIFKYGHTDFKENIKITSYLEKNWYLWTPQLSRYFLKPFRKRGHGYSYTEPIRKKWPQIYIKIPILYYIKYILK